MIKIKTGRSGDPVQDIEFLESMGDLVVELDDTWFYLDLLKVLQETIRVGLVPTAGFRFVSIQGSPVIISDAQKKFVSFSCSDYMGGLMAVFTDNGEVEIPFWPSNDPVIKKFKEKLYER